MNLPLAAALSAALALPALSHEKLDLEPALDPIEVSSQLIQLDKLYDSGHSIESALGDIEELVADLPSDPELRARLKAHVQDLAEQARQSFVHAQEIAALRREFVAARLQRSLDALRDRALAGGWSREEAQAVAAELIGRAETFVDAPEPAAFRNRVNAALERAYLQASSTSQMLSLLRIEILEDRLGLLEQELMQMVKTGQMSLEDSQAAFERQVLRARLLYQEWTSN